MSTKQITDTLFQITRFGMINCYLVVEDDGATLVDTGMAGMGTGLVAVAERLGLPIRRIALTHAHVDHAGALDELAGLRPDAEVFMSPRMERLLSGDLALEPGEPRIPLKGGFPRRDTRATGSVVAGEKVGSLRAVASPGHSPDHIAFLDERDSTLICGDAFQTKGGIAVAGVVRWRFPLPAFGTWNLELATNSAAALLDLAPARLAPGHGTVLEQPVGAMERAVAEAQEKLRRGNH